MSTSWHIAECPPKIRAFPGIGVAADCLEEKDLSLLGDAWKFVSDKRLYTPWPKCFCCQCYHRPNGVGSSHTCDMVILMMVLMTLTPVIHYIEVLLVLLMSVMCHLLPWSAGNRSLTVTLACCASYWSDPAHADDDDCADVAGDYAD